jgi:hypothetical protein
LQYPDSGHLDFHQQSKEANVSEPSKDTSIITVLAERLVKQRLPRLELLKAQLDRGETLTDNDILFLKQALMDAQGNRALIERHPEIQEIAAKVAHLYKEIMEKAIENEKNKAP